MKKIVHFVFIFLIINIAFSSEINWLSFEEGLKKAQKENKLILMDIYAKWCHWCNVIENTTYRDKKVIELIEKYYIPIRVDAEERPDINKKYNQGGLPSTLILDKNGNILFGAIYVPPEEMRKLLTHYAQMTPQEIKREVQRVKLEKELKLKRLKRRLKSKKITPKKIKKIYRYIKLVYDYKYGGLKGAPKFPQIYLPYFLMLYGIIFEDKKANELAVKTLNAYANLIDKVEGGIYRYSVNEYWSQPHYEKLLKDQAQLSILYFNGYSLYKDKNFLKNANLLINFAKNKLYDKKTGYFYNSQGADIVDEEGTLLMTGEEYFTKDEEGREIIQETLGYSPKIEKNVYFANNCIMASALVYSYVYNNNNEDLKTAEKLIKNIIKDGLKEKGVVHSKNIKEYYLSTQVYFLEALLNLYQITGDINYLNLSEKMLNILDKYYFSKKLGIYVDLKDTGINLSNISFIDDIFSLNARLVRVFYQIQVFTGEDSLQEKIKNITKKLPSKGKFYTSIAYFINLYPPTVIHIVAGTYQREKLIKTSFKVFPFYSFTQFINLNDKKLAKSLGYEDKGIYVCNANMCFKKIKNPYNLREEVFKILRKYKKFNVF